MMLFFLSQELKKMPVQVYEQFFNNQNKIINNSLLPYKVVKNW
jgi:hypothetical protein